MKNITSLLLFLLVGIFINVHGQDKTIEYDSKFYLLGFLGDYNGYGYVKGDNENIVDIEESDKAQYMYILDSLFKTDKNKDTRLKYSISLAGISTHNIRPLFILHSTYFSEFVNRFYRFKKSVYPNYNTKDENDSIQEYIGKLRYAKLRKSSENQIISFLAGVYMQYGITKNNQYEIRMVNSLSKMAVIKRLLKKYGCKEVKYIINKNGIPWINVITFVPSNQLKVIFDHEKELEQKLSIRTEELKQYLLDLIYPNGHL